MTTSMIEHLHRLAAHAYYCDEHDAGRRACERLLRMPIPPEREEKVRANRTWYTRPLSDLADVRLERIEIEPAMPGWSLFNPSVVKRGDELLVNVRSSNYQIVDGQYVMPPEDAGVIRTQNILLNLASGDRRELAADYPATGFPVTGLEDVRLNVVDGRLVASATIRDLAPHDGTCRIASAEITDGVLGELTCHDTVSGRHEKNWMPILGRKEWLYSCSTGGHICTVVDSGDEWTVTQRAESPRVARGFRGGSQLVPLDHGSGLWVAAVHEVATVSGRRVYEHRFVAFDEHQDWAITDVTPPFAFRQTRTIEFCAGLAVDGDDLVASFGLNDAEAWIARVPRMAVAGLLEPAE